MPAALEALNLATAAEASTPVASPDGRFDPAFRLDALDQANSVEEPEYRKKLKEYQQRLLSQQPKLLRSKHSVIVLAEGPDAAGKGGALNRLVERLDPRNVRVHSITKPTAEELAHHYLWRFWQKFPAHGQIAVFDRSWYGRVLVERVEGFATVEEWQRAYAEINQLEQMLTDDGTLIVKLYLHISMDEQLARFEKRLGNPSKAWKINDEDWRNRNKFDVHNAAAEDMVRLTSTNAAPWYVVAGNYKWFARLQVLRRVVKAVEALNL
jgi:polyphosphate kinase 2 (PPK2 family)